MVFALSTVEAPPPAPLAGAQSAPLCEAGLRITAGRSAPRPPPGARCQATVSLSGLPLTLDERFRPARGGARAVPPGWTAHFSHGPQTGPQAWDSRTLAGNHERQIYVDPGFPGSGDRPLRLSPFARGRDGLTIMARPTPRRLRDRLWGYDYISGLITSQGRFAQRYGYFEVRAKLPAGRGLWPAVWMLPKAGGWPPELDLLEQTGGTIVFQTVHTAAAGRPAEADFRAHVPGATWRFHTYGVLWTPERLVWFVDRRQTASAATPADLNQPMYLLINLAVGGDFAGPPSRTLRWPARLRIARVRAYGWPQTPAGAGDIPAGRPNTGL